MSTNGVTIVFGAGYSPFLDGTPDQVSPWLKTLDDVGITVIDTSEVYGLSEELLGKAGASSTFTIDTKVAGGFGAEPTTKDLVLKSSKESLTKLNTDSVDVYYIHTPDRRLPWKETLSGVNELYQQGAFKRLGLSNFLAHEVEEVVRVAKENSFVVPSVYQGNYSAVARRIEDDIFPVLRKHNMAFYAYSPIAGGFLSKTKTSLLDPEGRFGKDDMFSKVYNSMYNRPSFVEALDTWEQIAEDEGVSRAELAYRWVVYHSKLQGDLGDAVVVGASKKQQVRDTVAAIRKGPLSDGAAKRIDDIWGSVKVEASLDNFELTSKN